MIEAAKEVSGSQEVWGSTTTTNITTIEYPNNDTEDRRSPNGDIIVP